MRRKEVDAVTEKQHETMAEFFRGCKGTPFAEMMQHMMSGGRCAPGSCCGEMMSRMMKSWSPKEAQRKEAAQESGETEKK